MSERKISFSQPVFDWLRTEEGFETVQNLLKIEKLDAVFGIDVDNKNAKSVLFHGEHAVEAADLIESHTTEIKIKVGEELNRTQKWRDLRDEVRRHFKVYVSKIEGDTWIAGFKGDVSKALDRIQKFLNDNSIETESFHCKDKGVKRYIMEHRKGGIANMESTLEQYSVKITPGKSVDSFLISGTKIGIARMKQSLCLLTSSVAMDEMEVQQPGLHKFFTSGRGDRLVRSVEHEHQCAIEKVENPTTGSRRIRGEDVKISWKQGSIEAENADVLVGSCIGQLSNIFQRAGVSKIRKLRGNVSVVSQCGNLPCNHVIVTECRKWDGGKGAAERELRVIVQKCLQQALRLGATSIAFPIIGTGKLGFPYHTACKIMISEVINVTSGWSEASSLNDIRFVVFGQDAQLVSAFQHEFMASSPVGGRFLYQPFPLISLFRRLPVPSSGTTNAFGNVSVQVLQGDLTKEQTDAIVNINGTNMNMQNAGALSKAVAKAAGPAVQAECTKLGKQTPVSAVVTASGTLKVKRIIHAIPGKADIQHTQRCIKECLRVADSNMFQSLSMPAFGTGSYGMSEADSAQATFQALANECPNLQNLKQVRIVVFQQKMVSTFQQTLQEHLSKPRPPTADERAKPSTASKKSVHVNDGVKAIQFRIFGESKASVDRAQAALTKGFTEACKTQTVENEEVCKLSERQRDELKTKARQLDVTIIFEDRIQRIVVRGDPEDVSAIINHIWEEIQMEKEKEHAEVLYKTIKWQYELHGTRKYFSKSSNAVIEKAHANNDTRVTVEVEGDKGLISFADLTMTLSTGQKASIVRINDGEGIKLPEQWCRMPLDSNGKEETVHLVELKKDSAEYQKVHSLFQKSGENGKIVKIERIQNPHLYQQYIVRKQKMDKDNKGMNSERQLFHGTAGKNVNAINTTGFNRSYCGKNGTKYGNGVYFAVNASYSKRFTEVAVNIRHMYVASVLTGRYTQGHKGMIVPPTGFDSVADSTGRDASIFVVFYDAQCYPEYLIAFQ